uniref:N-acetyltransferase domain-containing protein n=1 Tax=Timema genevievae TaxID=629358 RepID=A0A7R9PLC1_TIMGE|nr:unnamed protein product [Timema genevievae]
MRRSRFESRSSELGVSSAADRVVHYTLSQILYNTYEPPSDNELEVLYDIPDRGDQIKILWLQKAAIGFYTVKLKGTLIENTDEKYAMHMLDTAYIRTTHRRQGHGLSILIDLLQGRVGQDMGLSSPISRSMWRVLKRFLRDFPEWRENLWEMEGAGKEGNRKLIWLSLASKNKQKNKDSTA